MIKKLKSTTENNKKSKQAAFAHNQGLTQNGKRAGEKLLLHVRGKF